MAVHGFILSANNVPGEKVKKYQYLAAILDKTNSTLKWLTQD
jgi:hypothetical protein